MPRETEAKFKVDEFAAVRRALRRAGAEYVHTAIQTDSYFDTPDHALRKADKGLRVRRTRYLRVARKGADDRALLTFKGPGVRSRRAKIRREVQTRLDDADAVVAVLEACGLRAALTIQKRRASYRVGDCLVELDELPVIGRFVEIEAPDEPKIERLRGRLALEGEPITDHYVNMLLRACDGAGGDCREITFAKYATCCRSGCKAR